MSISEIGLISLLIFATELVDFNAASEYAVVEGYNSRQIAQFCMIYYPEFRKLPETPPEQFEYLVNATTYDGCQPITRNYQNQIILTRSTTRCNLERILINYHNSHASGIILSTDKSRIEDLVADEADRKRLRLLVGYVSDLSAAMMLSMMPQKEPLRIRMYSKDQVPFDISLLIIWTVAVFTLCVGAYWSGCTRYEIYLHENGRVATVPPSRASTRRGPEQGEPSYEEESSLDVSPVLIALFVISMGVMLVILYFFFQYLVYFIIGMFALASVVSMIGVLEPIVYRIPVCTTKVPPNICPCFHGPLEIRQIVLILFAISVSVVWVVTRHHEFSWILQDILGVSFSINMLKTLRLPNLMICSLLLVLLFFYDIFFVFVTPYLTMKGESVMVEVARGGNTQEQLPMVLRVPHFSTSSLAVCFSQFSMLGFGDILVPGLLVSYCFGFDLIRNTGWIYYIMTTAMYGIGLFITFVALYLMRTPQPALLYLVPCTLVPLIIVSWLRGELGDLWCGFKMEGGQPRGTVRAGGTCSSIGGPPELGGGKMIVQSATPNAGVRSNHNAEPGKKLHVGEYLIPQPEYVKMRDPGVVNPKTYYNAA